MNIHLNAFHPYERAPWHEDQLTRAAMVVMRLMPETHDAFVRLASGTSASELPEPEFDMQTDQVQRGDKLIEELISVFLTPDEDRGEETMPVASDPRRQRLDGVIRYGPRLVVVIESKITEGADDWQARHINLAGVTPEETNVVSLRWQAIIEEWWRLLEGGGLNATASRLLEDFMDYADRHFSVAMPYSTLRRAGGDHRRIVRRLRGVLAEASGLRPDPGAVDVRFPRATSIQRINLAQREGDLVLSTWPAEQVPQAQHVYRSPDIVERLICLSQEPGWRLSPNVHLSPWQAAWHQRCYFSAPISIEEYLHSWTGEGESFGRYPRAEVEAPDFWHWLRDTGYASEGDREEFDRLLQGRWTKLDLRASIDVQRVWPWDEAVALDDRGELATAVRDAVSRILGVLAEPTLDVMAGTAT
jgi:hypothetical protein